MNPLQWLCVGLIRLYQWVISPLKNALFGPVGRCRFTPTCSQYAVEAIRRHGVFRGGWLAVRRLVRCNPWGAWGHDPVPGTGKKAGPERPGLQPPDNGDDELSSRHWVAGRCQHLPGR